MLFPVWVMIFLRVAVNYCSQEANRMGALTIGKLAKEAEVNVETVRYYERRGLIEQPKERRGAFRVYPADAVAHIRSIKRAQSLGFSLKEIKELFDLRLDENARCGDVMTQTERKLEEIDAKIRMLQRVERELRKLIAACEEEQLLCDCPIIEALDDGWDGSSETALDGAFCE
jgi:MerR family mercuric resistance operon transcriptional regulator